MRAICQDIVLNNKNINVSFVWASAEFFETQLMQTWKEKVDVVLSKIEDESQKHQQLTDACLSNIPADLSNTAVMACASPDLIYPLKDILVEKGLDADMILADVFQFMPR